MTPTRTAFAAMMLVASASVAAQVPTGDAPAGSTAADQAEPSPRDPIPRPKRNRLIDVIKAIAPPLIEAASSRPSPQNEPAPQPVVLIPPAEPAATVPAPSEAGTAIVLPPPSRPRPPQAEPRPSAPRQLPAAVAPRPASPVDRPAPRPPLAPPDETLAPLPPAPAPPIAEASLPPPPVARTVPPPAPDEPETPGSWWSGLPVSLLGMLALIAALVGAHRLRRMRRIARTRAALGVSPRLDAAAGASSISGLSLVAPPLSIRARLAPAANG